MVLPGLTLLCASGARAEEKPGCGRALAPTIRGVPVEEKIEFLENGRREICARSLSGGDCQTSFQRMVDRLAELRKSVDGACASVKTAPSVQSADRSSNAFSEQRATLEKTKQSLSEVREHLVRTSEEMRVIREHTVDTVRDHLRASGASRLPAQAEEALAAARNPATSPEHLRARILAMNTPAHHSEVNSLWVAANALELEQYSRRQGQELGETIAAVDRNTAPTRQREDRMGSLREGSGASSPIAGILSSPALPGLLGAAAQLAAAAKNSSGASAASPEPSSAPATAAEAAATAPSQVPASSLEAKESARGGGGENKTEDKKTAEAEKVKAGRIAGPSSGISGSRIGPGGHPPIRGAASAQASSATSSGGGAAGGENEAGRAPASEGAQSAQTGEAAGVSGGDGFLSAGGLPGFSGGGSGGGEAGPTTPTATGALEAILNEDAVDLPESPIASALAAESAPASEPGLFGRVRSAYVRALKAGLMEESPGDSYR